MNISVCADLPPESLANAGPTESPESTGDRDIDSERKDSKFTQDSRY